MTPTDEQKQVLTFAEVEAAGLADWRQLFEALRTRFATGGFNQGLELVTRIAALADEADHHPDVDLRYPHVNVTIFSHDVFGVTSRDVDLARAISAAAAELGIEADPTATGVVELALDTWDYQEIKPFWAAVLGMGDHPKHGEELRDLAGSQPTLWFQHTTEHDEPRQRFHLDVRVPADVADERIAAALAAGGVLVSDERAPRFTVLADAQGNKACVTTGLERD
ncbi:4a-hydroxytetrahydrobiopterin dehydratase [Nocardioides cynanchi]|uniref:4a-hydroxytetrahydrobiopterin dehydratase n=1 Tax=Nocardioides cynanchi TaxID=2558918 RepID=UPI001247A8FE|nr:4a-hydroxytetrahydrobiopterin dehydratase [Nocardioides cynanchi]